MVFKYCVFPPSRTTERQEDGKSMNVKENVLAGRTAVTVRIISEKKKNTQIISSRKTEEEKCSHQSTTGRRRLAVTLEAQFIHSQRKPYIFSM